MNNTRLYIHHYITGTTPSPFQICKVYDEKNGTVLMDFFINLHPDEDDIMVCYVCENLRDEYNESTPNLARMDEEEFFQYCLVWKSTMDIYLVQAVHKYMNEFLPTWIGEMKFWQTFEY